MKARVAAVSSASRLLLLAGFIVLAFALAGCGDDANANTNNGAGGASIAVHDGYNNPVGQFADADAAARKASDIAAFDVRAPRYLPPGHSLSAFVVLKDPAIPSFVQVELMVKSDDGGMRITQVNRAVLFDSTGEPVDAPSVTADVSRFEHEDAISYNAVTADSTVSLSLRKPTALPEAEVLATLGGLLQ